MDDSTNALSSMRIPLTEQEPSSHTPPTLSSIRFASWALWMMGMSRFPMRMRRMNRCKQIGVFVLDWVILTVVISLQINVFATTLSWIGVYSAGGLSTILNAPNFYIAIIFSIYFMRFGGFDSVLVCISTPTNDKWIRKIVNTWVAIGIILTIITNVATALINTFSFKADLSTIMGGVGRMIYVLIPTIFGFLIYWTCFALYGVVIIKRLHEQANSDKFRDELNSNQSNALEFLLSLHLFGMRELENLNNRLAGFVLFSASMSVVITIGLSGIFLFGPFLLPDTLENRATLNTFPPFIVFSAFCATMFLLPAAWLNGISVKAERQVLRSLGTGVCESEYNDMGSLLKGHEGRTSMRPSSEVSNAIVVVKSLKLRCNNTVISLQR